MLTKIRQFFCSHDWTCKAEQNIPPPTDVELSVAEFFKYAEMYCKKCGKRSELNTRYQK